MLLFNSVLILVLVLRYTLTILRGIGLANLLPIDHNICESAFRELCLAYSCSVRSAMHAEPVKVNDGFGARTDLIDAELCKSR